MGGHDGKHAVHERRGYNDHASPESGGNDQKNGRLKKLITENHEYSGIKIYSIGNIDNVVTENLWKAKVL